MTRVDVGVLAVARHTQRVDYRHATTPRTALPICGTPTRSLPRAKKTDAAKRGRFNLGEKLVLALAKTALIETTTGSVQF